MESYVYIFGMVRCRMSFHSSDFSIRPLYLRCIWLQWHIYMDKESKLHCEFVWNFAWPLLTGVNAAKATDNAAANVLKHHVLRLVNKQWIAVYSQVRVVYLLFLSCVGGEMQYEMCSVILSQKEVKKCETKILLCWIHFDNRKSQLSNKLDFYMS